MHTSRNVLDWAGTYEGLPACSDCAGIHTRLILQRDGSFELVARRLARDASTFDAETMLEVTGGMTTPMGCQRRLWKPMPGAPH
jgi:uncharacterized lipoprotein NlpE involved in copper resistance